MGKSKSYKSNEIAVMLDVIEEKVPISCGEWQRVAAIHNARYRGDEKRTHESIKRKFYDMAKTRAPTGDPRIPPEIQRALEIKDLIIAATEGDRGIPGSDSDDSFDPVAAGGALVHVNQLGGQFKDDDDDLNENNIMVTMPTLPNFEFKSDDKHRDESTTDNKENMPCNVNEEETEMNKKKKVKKEKGVAASDTPMFKPRKKKCEDNSFKEIMDWTIMQMQYEKATRDIDREERKEENKSLRQMQIMQFQQQQQMIQMLMLNHMKPQVNPPIVGEINLAIDNSSPIRSSSVPVSQNGTTFCPVTLNSKFDHRAIELLNSDSDDSSDLPPAFGK